MQRMQYRRNRAPGGGQDGGPERFEMVMDKIVVSAQLRNQLKLSAGGGQAASMQLDARYPNNRTSNH